MEGNTIAVLPGGGPGTPTVTKLSPGFFSEITTIPAVLDTSRFPSLDGLRGLAILTVLFSHLRLSGNPLYLVIFNGSLGVLFFFVLSGFLITTLCIKEKIITKDISLKNFYMRRVLRIFPVAYLYIIVIIILNFVFKLKISAINIAGAALYLMNFSSFFRKYYYSYFTGHYWSLSVEEQFYLIIPFILKRKFKAYLFFILLIVFVLPVFICLQYYFESVNKGFLYALTHYLYKFQSIATGCLFSVLVFKYSVTNTMTATTKVITNLLAFVAIFVIQYNDFFTVQSVLSSLLVSFLIGYIIITNLTPSKDVIFRFLNSKILTLIGVLSYSIYIWQEIFTSGDPRLPALLTTFPWNLICIAVVSCMSYYFYERFFLKLKSKFSRTGS